MTDSGLQTITLRDYQIEMLRHFQNNRFTITLASRQIGKTICSSIFIAWFALFNFDRNILVLSNKGATTREIIDKAKTILDNLPFFMKPGILKNDVFNMKFDNGCRLIGQSTTKKAAIGFTIHLLFLDEFAHIHSAFINPFFENVYPTLSSSQISRIIITSTPNGFNKFHEIYDRATKGLNEFKAFKVDWWQVPGRDEAWMKKEISQLGSESAFNRQYGNLFIEGSNLLLDPSDIMHVQANTQDYISHDFPDLDDLDIEYKKFLIWRPDFDTDSSKEDFNYFVFSVDIGEGGGGDYSIINIFQIVPMDIADLKLVRNPSSFQDFFKLKQIGRFKSNELTVEEFSKILYTLLFEIFYSENLKMVMEWNTYGGELLKNLQTIFPGRNEFDEELIVKFKHRIDASIAKFGLKIKADNKAIFCQNFKKIMKNRRIEFTDRLTVEESIAFGKDSTGRYKGQQGNDDLVMSCINVCEFLNTLDYSDFVEELYDMCDDEFKNAVETLLEKENTKGDGQMYYDIYDLLGSDDGKETKNTYDRSVKFLDDEDDDISTDNLNFF